VYQTDKHGLTRSGLAKVFEDPRALVEPVLPTNSTRCQASVVFNGRAMMVVRILHGPNNDALLWGSRALIREIAFEMVREFAKHAARTANEDGDATKSS
jgi:hypothetical protein